MIFLHWVICFDASSILLRSDFSSSLVIVKGYYPAVLPASL